MSGAWPWLPGLSLAWPPWAVLAALLLAALGGGALARRAGDGRGRMALRAAICALLAAALARPVLAPRGGAAAAVQTDVSGSVDPAAREAVLPDAVPVPGALGPAELRFGDEAASPVGAALDLALRAAGPDGRVLLSSDGLATDEGALDWARAAAAAGTRVDALVLAADHARDAAVTAIAIPPSWRAGDVASAEVALRASEPLSATLRLLADEREVGRASLGIPGGAEPVLQRFAWPLPESPGLLTLRAEVRAEGDERPGNDALLAIGRVGPAPRAIVVGEGAAAVELADVLAARGASVEVRGPERVPVRRSAYADVDAVVLVDVPAASLGYDQLAALEAFVQEQGGGLLLTGGRQSYVQGGWRGTALERMAPIRLEPPDRGEREAIALLLLLDRSASMGGGDSLSRITKLDLAREAALLSAEVLHPGDRIGVLAYDEEAGWILPFSEVGPGRALAEVEAALAALETGGGTRILSALDLGLPALAALDLPARHAVLLSDGRDESEEEAALEAAARRAAEQGVTLSTIALGLDADPELLATLARLGRGRYHLARDPADLPRLAAEESEIVRARAEQRGPLRVRAAGDGGHPLLAVLDLEALPALQGYLALREREGAAPVLASEEGDPLLATWRYGLGRVAAWTSDAGEGWADAWIDAEAGREAFSRMLRHVARPPGGGALEVAVELEDDLAIVTLDARRADGAPIDLADASFVLTGTEGVATRHGMRQVAPGRYRGDAPAPEAPGALPGYVALETEGERLRAPLALVRPYAPELRPAEGGEQRLTAIAAAGGGEVLAVLPPELRPERSARARPIWPWLLGLAALLWPVDVALQLRARRRPRLRATADPSAAPELARYVAPKVSPGVAPTATQDPAPDAATHAPSGAAAPRSQPPSPPRRDV